MSLTMRHLDAFIDTTINRLSGEEGTMVSNFYVDLRDFQNRITEKLIKDSIATCKARGLHAVETEGGLLVTVDLRSCALNASQAAAFNVALNYTRSFHGNHP